MRGFKDANGKHYGVRIDTQTIIDWELRTGARFLELVSTSAGVNQLMGTMHYVLTLAWLGSHDASQPLPKFIEAITATELKGVCEAVGASIREYVDGPDAAAEGAGDADPPNQESP